MNQWEPRTKLIGSHPSQARTNGSYPNTRSASLREDQGSSQSQEKWIINPMHRITNPKDFQCDDDNDPNYWLNVTSSNTRE